MSTQPPRQPPAVPTANYPTDLAPFEGKAISSRNSFKLGTARAVIIPGEDPADLSGSPPIPGHL